MVKRLTVVLVDLLTAVLLVDLLSAVGLLMGLLITVGAGGNNYTLLPANLTLGTALQVPQQLLVPTASLAFMSPFSVI